MFPGGFWPDCWELEKKLGRLRVPRSVSILWPSLENFKLDRGASRVIFCSCNPDIISQSVRALSDDATASCLPSGKKATADILAPWTSSSVNFFDAVLRSRTIPSSDPKACCSPSTEKASVVIGLVTPSSFFGFLFKGSIPLIP
jgi:hypothetical protein